jgi:hypothetical protein
MPSNYIIFYLRTLQSITPSFTIMPYLFFISYNSNAINVSFYYSSLIVFDFSEPFIFNRYTSYTFTLRQFYIVKIVY